MKPIDVRTASYFSTGIKIGGACLLVAGVAIAAVNIYVGLAVVITSVLVLTTHYRISIDFDNKTYYDYVWILGLKNGEKGSFEKIQYIFINKSKVSLKMNSRATSSTIMHDEFNGYLKFSETNKLHLASSESKTDIVHKMQGIALLLKCDMLDYTMNDR